MTKECLKSECSNGARALARLNVRILPSFQEGLRGTNGLALKRNKFRAPGEWLASHAFDHLGIRSFFRHSDLVIRHLPHIKDVSKAAATLLYRAKVRA